jgi:thiamine kinase-like enzyme
MNQEMLLEYSADLGIQLTSLKLIQENKYCLIYEAEFSDNKCIIKKYRGEDPALIKIEAQALDFYHQLSQENVDLIDSGAPSLIEEKNLLRIGFVEGEAFSDFLYRARKNKELRNKANNYIQILGWLIRTIYEKTQQPEQETAPLIYEYFEYTSKRLEEISVLGTIFFKGYRDTAKRIADKFRNAKITPSFVHGDFVFKNIHVRNGKVGLIDFANAIYLSHPLNDIYNMLMALGNMFLPKSFKSELINSFKKGLGPVQFPEIAHEFYYEYQRQRWLMLKLSYFEPKEMIQGFIGLATFAKPSGNKVKSL